MARVENDTTDSEDSDGKLTIDGEGGDAKKDAEKDDSDDDSISSSDDDEDENGLEQKVTVVEEKILQNPYIYKDHLELISILQQLANCSRMRSAYERLSGLCPLAPKQWLSWLQLEEAAASSPEERKQLYKLFDRAFVDCYSASIYMEWCAMSMGGGDDEADARTIISRALQAAGSDPMDGAMLWDTAKEYELAHLSLMKSSNEEYPTQVMRVFNMFSNQLSRPLLLSDKILQEFRTFTDTMQAYIPDVETATRKVEEAHRASKEILKKIMDFENDLEAVDDTDTEDMIDKCNTYRDYISHVTYLISTDDYTSFDLVSLLSVLYDRATSDCCGPAARAEAPHTEAAEDLCVNYIEYISKSGSAEETLNVIDKVIRRCPRRSRLWIMKLHHIERMGMDLDQIKSELENALFCGFDGAAEYVAVWLCYLEALRRLTDFSVPQQVERLRKTFRLAWESLGQMWGDTADTEFTILQFWARIEYNHTKDYEYGKELFDEIFEYADNRLRGGLWLELVALEKLRGGVARARATFRRAVRCSADVRLQRAWLALERDHGTLDTVSECIRICEEKAKEWVESTVRVQRNDKYKKKDKDAAFLKNKKKRKGKGDMEEASPKNYSKADDEDSNNHQDDVTSSTLSKEISNSKKRKFDAGDSGSSMSEDSFGSKRGNKFSGNGDQETSNYHRMSNNAKRKMEDPKNVPTKRLKNDHNNKTAGPSGPPPPGYEGYKPADVDDEKNDRTAFISNLDFNVDEDDLRAKLSVYGAIDEMRLVKGVRSFGSICYCVYKAVESLSVALKHDRTLLGNRPMFVSRYCPTRDSRTKHFLYPTGVERNKLFVKNISFDHCTDQRLRDVFAKYGPLKDIRIVTYKTGNPKGLAYVEYEDEKSAGAALSATDGLEVGGRALSVALSAPPPRKTDTPSAAAVNQNTSLRGHSRTQLFMPSVLLKAGAPVVAGSINDSGDSVSPAKLSNSDFRSMMLGKK